MDFVPNCITFSTLACPEWAVETIVVRAAQYGYDGLEWRGGPEGHVQPSLPSHTREQLRRRVSESGLFSLAVTAYTSFVSDNFSERQANIDELRRYLDLAAELKAQYVRAFLGELPAGAKLSMIHEHISQCLEAAAIHAESVGVGIAVEPHDDFVRSSSVAAIFEKVTHPHVRAVWDIGNAFAAGEDPAEGFEALGKRLAYVQVKDGVGRDSQWRLTPLGEGEVPLARACEFLWANNYAGALSVEWERAWHPELDPPEIALPQALKAMRRLLAAAHRAVANPLEARDQT